MALPVPSLVQASHQMALSVPYGFTFSPELIYILYRKVNGNSLPVDEGLIEERDLFGKEEPIFGRGTEKTRYFFVKLKKKGKSVDGSNFVRTVGKGSNTNGRWLMKEYHLHGVLLQPPPKLNDYVLRRIRKKDDGKKQNVPFDTEAHSRCQRIGGNQDGEADAAIMVESIDKERDQRMDQLGAENCIPALSEGISKCFTQDDDAEFFRGLSPIFEKFSDEGFGGMLWTKSEAEQMGDPQESLQDLEINCEMFC
ncbi:hypothetical protein Acr_00g0015270 [Actinidia rufa]|uniref:NAC domain-containing protein n=1 Tax=Actinidia rufa TaxID=165716 RepID=A0A7J0DB56_9ERIC|nr:hypothetical protein Acr_00g0015270 [Actinidia rufa]